MIKKISKVSNMGVFQNFDWDAGAGAPGKDVTFRKVNIIYGRNYSGKTTLSRIIRSAETKQLPPNYEGARFELEFEDGNVVKPANLDASAKQIRVFNTDFVAEHLGFLVEEKGDIKAFALVGRENLEAEAEIASLQRSLGDGNPPTGLMGDLLRHEDSLNTIEQNIEQKKGN